MWQTALWQGRACSTSRMWWISGPKTYVARVSKVVADVNLNDKLSETATINIEPKAVDVYGNKVDYISLNYGAREVDLDHTGTQGEAVEYPCDLNRRAGVGGSV